MLPNMHGEVDIVKAIFLIGVINLPCHQHKIPTIREWLWQCALMEYADKGPIGSFICMYMYVKAL